MKAPDTHAHTHNHSLNHSITQSPSQFITCLALSSMRLMTRSIFSAFRIRDVVGNPQQDMQTLVEPKIKKFYLHLSPALP